MHNPFVLIPRVMAAVCVLRMVCPLCHSRGAFVCVRTTTTRVFCFWPWPTIFDQFVYSTTQHDKLPCQMHNFHVLRVRNSCTWSCCFCLGTLYQRISFAYSYPGTDTMLRGFDCPSAQIPGFSKPQKKRKQLACGFFVWPRIIIIDECPSIEWEEIWSWLGVCYGNWALCTLATEVMNDMVVIVLLNVNS